MHAADFGMHEALDSASTDGPRDPCRVCILGAWEAAIAIQQDDRVASGQGNCILDGRITGADYDDGLPAQCVR